MKTIPTPSAPLPIPLAHWVFDPIGFMESNFKAHGDLFTVNLWPITDRPYIFVNEPKALQYILTHDTGKEFTAPGEVNDLLEQMIGRQNVMLLSGQAHRQRRKLVMPPFHGNRLQVYGEMIQQIALEVAEQLPTDQPLDLRNTMQKITMRIILEVVFGLKESDSSGLNGASRYQQLEQMLGQRLEMTGNPLSSALLFFPVLQADLGPWSPGHQIKKLSEQIDQLLFAEIEERRVEGIEGRVDILSLLLASQDEQGNGLSNQDLRDELLTLLVAGHETTATALTWAFYWIHHQPNVKHQLLEELDATDVSEDPAKLISLPYLTAVCNETLRIHPVAMLTFPREVQTPMELCGYQLEPGMLLLGCISLIHQREELYPQPQQFRPERFLERQFSPYEFVPFGGGVRRCIGYALAQYEMKIVLGTFLQQIELQLLNTKPVKPGRRGVTLGQAAPVKMQKVGKRQKSQRSPLVTSPS